MRFPVNHALPLAALILLGAGTAVVARDRSGAPLAPVTGPAADYPVVVGDAFTIGGTVWTPIDQLNYDAVGKALVSTGADGLAGVSAAHKTLPLPSYVEVTALDSGRTALVRLLQRGPMDNDVLIALSPDAAAQLGLAPGSRAPVRVRRFNPPEPERALLRNGGQAPNRMETPEGLLKVLRRKLADQSPLAPPASSPPTMPAGPPSAAIAKPGSKAAPSRPVTNPAPKPTPTPASTPIAPPPASAAKGSTVVQVAAFSSQASARKVAAQLGGSVSAAGKLWRVRLGPFTNRAKAAPALEKAKRAGYKDARIQSAD